MKINTWLKIVVLVPVLMAIIISMALFYSLKVIERDQQSSIEIRRIINSTNEMETLSGSYLLYHEDRPREQFMAEHDSVIRRITALDLNTYEQLQLIDSIRRNTELTKTLYQRLVSNYEHVRPVESGGLIREAEERLQGQLLVKSREVVSDALRLDSLVNQEITATQKRTVIFIFIIIILTAIPSTIVLLYLARHIGASINKLRKGIEIIGTGNLDHRIDMPAVDELGELAGSFDRMTERLQAVTVSKDALENEVDERKRAEVQLQQSYEQEHYIAQVLQKAIVPPVPVIGDDYDIASVYIPAFTGEEVGGDFYDVFRLVDGRIGILIGDVSGKGVEAAAHAASTRSTVRALAYNLTSPRQVFTSANRVLHPQHPDSFVTSFFAIITTENGHLTYSAAGHPPPAILKTDGTVCFLKNGDLPLGVLPEYEYTEAEAQLSPGDEIILYTDGVNEARPRGGKLFGYDRVKSVLQQLGGEKPDYVCGTLLDAARNWAEGSLRDDTAIMVVQRIAKPSGDNIEKE